MISLNTEYTKRCPICGKKVIGRYTYCDFCASIKKWIIRRLKKEKHHKNTQCKCCGKTLKNRKHYYCDECAPIAKKIKWREYMNKYMQRKRGTDTMKEAFDDIEISIDMSDKNFVSQICNEDCINCQYDDCILPVDED